MAHRLVVTSVAHFACLLITAGHLSIALEGGNGPQQFWLDDVVLLANQTMDEYEQ